MARPGIMLYFDILEPIRVLPDSDKGRLLVAMLEYGQDGIVPDFDGMLALAWGFVKPKIDRDKESYDKQIQQKQYASFAREIKKRELPHVSFEDWKALSDIERDRLISADIGRYPTTSTTTTASATVTPSTSTNSTTSATAAAAATVTETPEEFAATAAEDRKLKIMNGELGKGVVVLTDFQMDVLMDKLGLDMFDYYVDKLSTFIIENDAKVKSHYQTILKWWMEDSQEGGGRYESL